MMNNENTSFSHEIACLSIFTVKVIYYVIPQLRKAYSQLITPWFKLHNSAVGSLYLKSIANPQESLSVGSVPPWQAAPR